MGCSAIDTAITVAQGRWDPGMLSGNGVSFVLAPYDGAGNLASANSLSWAATPGLNYFDIGAYEFQGDSSDVAPPTGSSTGEASMILTPHLVVSETEDWARSPLGR